MSAEADIFDVAIIGGGFSGMMVLHHLVRTAGNGGRFAIIEPEENLGCGLAYRTSNPAHLLNVPAGKMSAFPDIPDHFINWLISENGQERAWRAGDYTPRCLYARYLQEIARKTFLDAEAKGVHVQHVRQKAVDVQRNGLYTIALDNSKTLNSRSLVLATGNLTAAENDKIPGFVADPWRHDHASQTVEEGAVGIIGTGLTTIDTILSLRSAGFTGEILAVSRRGLLPEVHNDAPAVYNAALSLPAHAPEKLAPLMQALRHEAKNCLSNQITWQRVFDRWRPHAAAIWGKLGTQDRNRFFTRLFTLWNIHRHRMAPEIGAVINQELASGKLKILKGRVNVTQTTGGLNMAVDGRQYDVRRVFDCRGVCHDISKSGSGLIAALHRKGLIQRHDTGWGIKVNSDQQVFPTGQDGSFLAIGSPLIGEYLETTAVPELRQQAQKVALDLGGFIEGRLKLRA